MTTKSSTTRSKGSVFLIALVSLILGFVGSFGGVFAVTMPQDDGETVIVSGELTIHFLELGNNNTGDSIYIKAGNNDILIDAGSRTNSAPVIQSYVDTYCTDNTLEYVIATHAHQDHYAAFAGSEAYPSIFERYDCKTIIDFAKTNQNESSTTSIYAKYKAKRDAEAAIDENHVHYTAAECWNEENGAKQTYDLGSGITMSIVYNYYYFNASSDENNYSVCILITHGSYNFLFTGDLEKEGEEKMVEFYTQSDTDAYELPEVELFKAGHHGSPTSSNSELLNLIKPKIVAVCCCAGAVEYTQNPDNTFPSVAFLTRVAPHTDCVFVTTLGKVEYNNTKGKNEDTGFESLNGTIIVTSSSDGINVKGTNSDLKLRYTEWFKANRYVGGVDPYDWTEIALPLK